MKKLLLFPHFVLLLSCSNLDKLNERIYKAQEVQIQESPYKSANRMFERIKAQKPFRSQMLRNLLGKELRRHKEQTDTLLILENFDEICFNCSSDVTQVLYQNTVYIIERKNSDNKTSYVERRREFDSVSKSQHHFDESYELTEIVNKIKRGENWKANPLDYGYDSCLDGNHSLLTIVYPEGKIQSLYVRCWTPAFQRK